MSDHFYPLSFTDLTKMVLYETDHKDSFFGIPSSLFYLPPSGGESGPFVSEVFGRRLEIPLGPAAGPHTQLAQNIIASWLCGARYIELKTVQTLDRLDIPRPCIDMQDEGYNCEWSQELLVRQSFEEYVNAWVLIHVLNHKFRGDSHPGVVFNMSVGYNLEGIMQENVQWFLKKMRDAGPEIARKIEEILPFYPKAAEVIIPSCISDNITLSTMHGCPAEEIEDIAGYLITEQQLHTYVKLNPTLLGSDLLRELLNDVLGFDTVVPDQAFAHDLKYEDALKMVGSLRKKAFLNKREFGLKLTNTLESENRKQVFGPDVEMMYMSGRALHPISVTLAAALRKEFGPDLPMSFSAGADAFNIIDLLKCGFKTVTVCTDLLKPGGYMRLGQYLERMHEAAEAGVFSLKTEASEAMENLFDYAEKCLSKPTYKRNYLIPPNIKTSRHLGMFDCISAPCRDTCATRQDIPEYLYFSSKGDFRKAFDVILKTNPFPSVTGMVCDHLCQNKCTRVHYDDPLLIREVKRFAAEQAEDSDGQGLSLYPAGSNGKKVGIAGAGPTGLSCAWFLALSGCHVDVFESRSEAGGMVHFAIPGFRLTPEAFKKDLNRICNTGVKIHYQSPVGRKEFDQMLSEYDAVYVGVGAQRSAPLGIPGNDAAGVIDPLDFLYEARKGNNAGLGEHVVIIGGGNTAMDAARTAFRMVGEHGRVVVVYRRSINEMPADQGEIKAVLEEGVEIMEMVAPLEVVLHKGKVSALKCIRTKLSADPSGGRPKPVTIEGSEFEIACDTIIPAIGQLTDFSFAEDLPLSSKAGIYKTPIPKVWLGGDALRGASTAINAIADGRLAAENILEALGVANTMSNARPMKEHPVDVLIAKRARRMPAAKPELLPPTDRQHFRLVQQTLARNEVIYESSRCLHCDEICSVCTTVCPNLANYTYAALPATYQVYRIKRNGKQGYLPEQLPPFSVSQTWQIINLADFCNACGNCHTFCPAHSAPYLEKPRLHFGMESFRASEKGFYLEKSAGIMRLWFKQDGREFSLEKHPEYFSLESQECTSRLDVISLRLLDVRWKLPEATETDTAMAPVMAVVMQAAADIVPY